MIIIVVVGVFCSASYEILHSKEGKFQEEVIFVWLFFLFPLLFLSICYRKGKNVTNANSSKINIFRMYVKHYYAQFFRTCLQLNHRIMETNYLHILSLQV